MADYQLTASGMIERTADGAILPFDAANADYQAFVAWLEAGNTIEPTVAPAKDETFLGDPWHF